MSGRHLLQRVPLLVQAAAKHQQYRYLPHAFIINNTQVEGPILCLPESWLLWNVKEFSDISSENLAILDLVDPAPEVLVVGCGAAIRPLPAELQQFLKARGIATEVLDTRNALSYFNFMNDEGRPVVAALLPLGSPGS
eukprot:gene11083-11239_t